MALLVAAFLVSLVPSISIFLWLRGIQGDAEFKGIGNKALLQGALSIFPVLGCSLVFAIIERLLTSLGLAGLPKAAFHTFIVLALAEELCKCFMFHRLLAKFRRAWSWLDYIILMTFVGIGFGLAEDIPYAIGAGPIVMIVRGVTCMHGGYGFIMGYLLGKAKKTDSKALAVASVAVPWLLHGAYDFGLSNEFIALGDWAGILSVSLAVLALVTLIVLVVFFIRHKDDERYRTPMVEVPELAAGSETAAVPVPVGIPGPAADPEPAAATSPEPAADPESQTDDQPRHFA